MSQVAHQAGAYPGFCSIKRLRIFAFPPGWDASPSQGYRPSVKFASTHLYTWEKRGTVKNTTQCPRPGLEPGLLDPEMSTLTMRPPCLPLSSKFK